MDAPDVRYAKSGDVNIAYAVVGEGPFDLVFVSGWVLSAFEVAWDGPPRDFYERAAAFSRLILFDKRGTGLSDRDVGVPDLETRMDDVRAVMDAAGSKRAAVMGVSEGGPMTALFAATHPERTAAAVLYGSAASFVRADDYPYGPTRAERLARLERQLNTYGTDAFVDEVLSWLAPTAVADEDFRRWFVRLIRMSASPSALHALNRMNVDVDVRHVLQTISVPTLVLHRIDDKDFVIGEGRYLAQHIPGAELVELPGEDHAWFADPEQITREVERFLTAAWKRGDWDAFETERVLATVLFTDIVGATAKAVELGDRRWRELLSEHHARVRQVLARYRGRELDTAGDGFFASFDGPARAIRAAGAIADAVDDLGIEIRAGLHTGECELIDGKVGGIAVHIGARVAAQAAPGQLLVSSTVRDLVAGSGIAFRECGTFDLKGVPGEWRLYAVERLEGG